MRREEKRQCKPPCVYVQNASVCTVRTSPCVPATGPNVQDIRACCRYTRRRPDRTHGGVLNVHTGGFPRAKLHQHHMYTHKKQHTTHPTDTPHRTHNTHTPQHTHAHTTPHAHTNTRQPHTTPHAHTTHTKQHTPQHIFIKTVTTVTPVTSVILMRIYCFRFNINL